MKIFTGNFANVKKYVEAGLTPVSIALSARYFSGVSYRDLSPEWSFKDDEESVYTPKFIEKISKLNKEKVINDLALISKGKDIILLCHEKYGDFCHRHLVNDWIGGCGEFGKVKEKQESLF